MEEEIIHTQALAEGELTVFSNGDYILVEGDPNDVNTASTYYQHGNGPYHIQLLVNRIVSYYELRNGLEQDRARSGVRTEARRATGTQAVRGMSQEDRLGVPMHMRSGTSRFRSDQRLRDPRTGDEEQLRRDRLQAALVLGQRMGRLHAHLQHLINTQADQPRISSEFMSDSTPTPGLARLRPSELQQAIWGGLIIEGPGGHLSLADLRRGLDNDIVDLLAQELPGFQIQYEQSYQREQQSITDGILLDFVLTVIDILDVLLTLGASALLSGLRRAYQGGVQAIRRGTIRASRGSAERGARGAMREGEEAFIGEVVTEIPPGAIDATPRRGGTSLTRQPAQPPRQSSRLPQETPEAMPRTSTTPESLPPPRQPRQLLPENPVYVEHAILQYHGSLVSSSPQETLIREIFGEERLREILAGFRLMDEVLPDAISRVSGRRRIVSGRGAPAAADVRLRDLEQELRQIIPDRPLRETDSLTAAQQTRAIEILAEARRIARSRWDTLRERLWRELYDLEEVRRLLRMMERDGLIQLPRGFPNTSRAPRAIAGSRDGIIWLRTQENVPLPQIARELRVTTEYIERRLTAIRRSIAAGRGEPALLYDLSLNLDHITSIQLNPFNFFHPQNLRVLTASYNDNFLRLYQMRSAFPMTDDTLEAWIKAFRLW